MLPRGGVDGRHRDVDAVPLAAEARGQGGEVVALAAADVEHGLRRGEGQQTGHGVHQRRLESSRLEPLPRREDRGGVTRPGRLPLLGLNRLT